MARVSGYIRAIEAWNPYRTGACISRYLIRRINIVKNAKNLQSTI